MIVMTCLGDFIHSLSLFIAVLYYDLNPDQLTKVIIKSEYFILSSFPLACTVEGFVSVFGVLISFGWTVNIAFTLVLSIHDIPL
jgi:hypothetical protein